VRNPFSSSTIFTLFRSVKDMHVSKVVLQRVEIAGLHCVVLRGYWKTCGCGRNKFYLSINKCFSPNYFNQISGKLLKWPIATRGTASNHKHVCLNLNSAHDNSLPVILRYFGSMAEFNGIANFYCVDLEALVCSSELCVVAESSIYHTYKVPQT